MDSNSEIQGYNVYPIVHFHRKFSSGVTMAMNSTSIVDSDTDVCFLEPYEIAFPSNNTAKPEIDFLFMQSL